MKIQIFTDGGSRGNPGIAGAGFFVADENGQQLFEKAIFLGEKTNNEAEYLGFLASAKWLLTQKDTKQKIEQVTWKLDSKLVVEQLNKNWKIKEPRLQVFAQEAWQLLAALPHPYKIIHIPRSENSEADRLANLAMDAGK